MYFPETIARSRKFSDAARIRTSACCGPGVGWSRSTRLTPSKPVAPFATVYAFILLALKRENGFRLYPVACEIARG